MRLRFHGLMRIGLIDHVKVSDVLKLLKEGGWCLIVTRGSHRQFKHDKKKDVSQVRQAER